MRSFVRFLVIIIVLGLASGTVYYASKVNVGTSIVNNDNSRNENNIEQKDENLGVDNSHNEVIEPPIVDVIPNEETEHIYSSELEETYIKLDALVRKIEENQAFETFDTTIGKGVLGIQVDEYLNSFELNELSAQISRIITDEGVLIIVSPMPDFLDIQEFYYDQYGNLLLYNSVSTGVGGVVHYYFSNNNLITTENHFEENVTPIFETQTDIILKSNNIYSFYGTNV